MRHPSLRTVLIFPYVTLVIILALAIGALSYQTGSQAVRTVAEHLLEETVNRIGQAIERHVVGSVATLEAAFPNGMLAPKNIETDFDDMRTRFWIATSLHIDPNNYVYYGNLDGQAIGLYRRSFEEGELRVKYFPEEHRKRYRIDGINGIPVFESTEAALFDPRHRPWFQAAQSSDEDIWTSVYIDFGTQDLVATRARRVLDKNGELQGVVATDMPLTALNDFVGTLDISPNGTAFIIEPNGLLIASSSSPNVKQLEDGSNRRINAADSCNSLLREIYQQIQPQLEQPLASGSVKTAFFTDTQGEQINVAFASYEDQAGLRWINVVALPDRDFMGGISNNVMRTLFLGFLATIIVVFIGLSILNWVTGDLKQLSIAANQIGSGRQQAPLDIRRNDEIGTLAKSFQAMQYRLQTDHLTGLPNRYAFEQNLNAAIERYQQDGTPFAVMFIDINDFKLINDRFGHDAGDQALIEIALRLRTHIRKQDLVARYAGDEFVALLDGVFSNEDLEPIQKNIEQALATPLQAAKSTITCLGGAIGVAHFPDDADNAKDLLILADDKMYTHKADCKKQS
ncbi:diguanylate cyclase (GGDEF) domain-containing protein [Malonomonas rubra DSM 5091]|uniref:Diguanylate cyclase (GGDEF) domain-containing protein n=1 Tax=Malonomonas rubra DSM 5091 TaxID=1122189 RepID=A0A1M6FLC9_MALRU|nr:sensor domain-containing diguanylate cyclase [Malonomonas rubra]SHI98449.1 diguanylate cyclase (GGDEF) domain-containing protein [Malonomonas rubra DSM 5091]